jgi:hypothetical protein
MQNGISSRIANIVISVAAALAATVVPSPLLAQTQIPNEYESTGGSSLGFANAGSAASGGISAVRANPAMLPFEKQYQMAIGYHWPTAGREFFQAGVVDSQTSSFAAGVSYTGYTDPYKYSDESTDNAESLDSPVVRRGLVGIGKTLSMVSVGLSVQYVEGMPLTASREEADRLGGRVKGTGIGLGIAALATPALRIGASAENLSNKRIEPYAPKTYRVGASYILGESNLVANIDFRQRDRVEFFEAPLPIGFGINAEDATPQKELAPERMVILSGLARVQNFMRVMASYGQTLADDERRTLAGGVILYQEKFSLAYAASQPYMSQASTQHSLNIGFDLAF